MVKYDEYVKSMEMEPKHDLSDMTPEEIIQKVESGEISSVTYENHEDFIKELRKNQ